MRMYWDKARRKKNKWIRCWFDLFSPILKIFLLSLFTTSMVVQTFVSLRMTAIILYKVVVDFDFSLFFFSPVSMSSISILPTYSHSLCRPAITLHTRFDEMFFARSMDCYRWLSPMFSPFPPFFFSLFLLIFVSDMMSSLFGFVLRV